jgi:hypothetical protein
LSDEEVEMRRVGLQKRVNDLEVEHIEGVVLGAGGEEEVARRLLEMKKVETLRKALARTEAEVEKRQRKKRREQEAERKRVRAEEKLRRTREEKGELLEKVQRVMQRETPVPIEGAREVLRLPAQFTWRWVRRAMKLHDPPLALRMAHQQKRPAEMSESTREARDRLVAFITTKMAQVQGNVQVGHTLWNADQKSRKFVFGSRRTMNAKGEESVQIVTNGDEKADITTWYSVSLLGDKG